MALSDIHKLYLYTDTDNLTRCSNNFLPEWSEGCPKYDCDPFLAITYIAKFIKHTKRLKVKYEDVWMLLFLVNIPFHIQVCLAMNLKPKSVSSFTCWVLRGQTLEDAFQELKETL